MLHLRKVIKVEFQVFSAIVLVAAINIIIFTTLSPNKIDPLNNIIKGIENVLLVYILAIVAGTIFVFLKHGNFIKIIFYAILSAMTFHIIYNLFFLILDPTISDNGKAILADALLIWTASLFAFSLWYWVVDRGGPVARATEADETRYDLLFPQYQSKIPGWDNWHPQVLDYIFFSFFTSTGFSPADTLPLTKRVKFLMMVEAFISLIIIGMVVSRAISLIQ